MKPRYSVTIEPISAAAQKNWGPDYRWHVSMHKTYGDSHGVGTCCRSKEEVISRWQRMRRDWEGHDSILDRQGDKVTMANLLFASCTKEITREDLGIVSGKEQNMAKTKKVKGQGKPQVEQAAGSGGAAPSSETGVARVPKHLDDSVSFPERPGVGLVQVDLNELDPNPYQVREWPPDEVQKLAVSIEQSGLGQVPTGRSVGGRVQVAAGHGRVAAFRLLAQKEPAYSTIPIILQPYTDQEMALMAMVENKIRRDMTPTEEARAAKRFLESFPEWTQTALAERLGTSQSNLSNMIRVLGLPQEVLDRVDKGELAWTVARELLVIDGFPEMMEQVLKTSRDGGSITRERVVDAIFNTVLSKWRRLFKTAGFYGGLGDKGDPLFNKAELCEGCERRRPVPILNRMWSQESGKTEVKEEYRDFCTAPECWDKHQEDYIAKRDAAAKKRAETAVRKQMVSKPAATRPWPKEFGGGPQPQAGEPESVETISQGIVPAEEALREAAIESEGEWPESPPSGDVPALMEAAPAVEEKAPPLEIPERFRPITIAEANKLVKEAGGFSGPDEIAKYWLRDMANPEECTTTCTKGFHIVYDPTRPQTPPRQMCCNPKCHRGKRALFSKHRNKANDAKIEAEKAAIAQVLERFKGTLGAIELRLVLRALHFRQHGYPGQASLSIINDMATKTVLKELGVDLTDYSTYRVTNNYRRFIEAVGTATEGWLAKKILEAALENLKHGGDRTNWAGLITDDLAALGGDVTILKGAGAQQEAESPAPTD